MAGTVAVADVTGSVNATSSVVASSTVTPSSAGGVVSGAKTELTRPGVPPSGAVEDVKLACVLGPSGSRRSSVTLAPPQVEE